MNRVQEITGVKIKSDTVVELAEESSAQQHLELVYTDIEKISVTTKFMVCGNKMLYYNGKQLIDYGCDRTSSNMRVVWFVSVKRCNVKEKSAKSYLKFRMKSSKELWLPFPTLISSYINGIELIHLYRYNLETP
jgi:hypothetical protein